MHHKYDLSLILACFNEAEIFSQSIKQIVQVLDKTDWTYEIIFIDDSSFDKTPQLIKQALQRYPRKHMSMFFHKKNQGRGQTVSDGFSKAKGKIVGFVDIDLEIPAWYIPRFVESVNGKVDGAVARRVYDLNFNGIVRWVLSKGYIWIRQQVLTLPVHDTEAGYKFFKRDKILPVLKTCKEPRWFWDTEIVAKALQQKLCLIEIPVIFVRRHDKTSTVHLIHDVVEYLAKLWKYRKELSL